jgi:hypothetical protein
MTVAIEMTKINNFQKSKHYLLSQLACSFLFVNKCSFDSNVLFFRVDLAICVHLLFISFFYWLCFAATGSFPLQT